MKRLLLLLLLALATTLTAQQQVMVQVNASTDDVEESLTSGALDVTSSDLELGAENTDGTNPQLIGLRFGSVAIPKNALITNARIVFTVDEADKNADPSMIAIKAQDADNPGTFNGSMMFNVSSRPTLAQTVNWMLPAGGWLEEDANGPDQTTPNLAVLVQALVNRDGWASGNAMVFTMSGTGTRTAESFEGEAGSAPVLVIDYIETLSVSAQVGASTDDVEESLTSGNIDVTSSDLEFGSENRDGSNPQLVGIRFASVNIEPGAVVTNAYIQFTVDESEKIAGDGTYTIKAEMSPNAAAFNGTAGEVSARSTFSTTVDWTIADGTWNNVGDAGAAQRSADIAELVNAIISQDGWAAGNAMVFTVEGTGSKVAISYDNNPASAPMLNLNYVSGGMKMAQVGASTDDVEESLTSGNIDVTSSDLEFGSENSDGSNPQLVGIRFASVDIEPGTPVNNAYIQFTVDEAEKIAGDGTYTIRAEMSPNAAAFDGTNGEVSARATFSTTVDWTIAGGTWNNVGDAGSDQRTADISGLIEAIINQNGWAAGNAMVFTVEGTGSKVAISYDNNPAAAPKLVINTLESPISDEEIVTVLEGCDDEVTKGDPEELELEVLGTYATGVFDEAAAEIAAYDPTTSRLFFTNANANTVTILTLINPSAPGFITDLDMSQYGGGVNSVAVNNGIVAVAVEAEEKTDNGSVVFFDSFGNFINQVTVGPLPDMLTFTPDGTKVLVANEGEPSDDYMTDPEGSVSIIDLSAGAANATVTNVGFAGFNSMKVSLQNKGIRIFGPNATVAQDFEPEYITVTEDNARAYVSLQENNAFAVIDIALGAVLDIQPLGYKNYNSGRPKLNEFTLNELIDLPDLGTPQYGGGQPTVKLGGFSGLYFDANESTETNYVFYAIPDRGPNADAVGRNTVTPAAPQNLRPYKLPDYQSRIVKFSIDLVTGEAVIDDQIFLAQQDGTPISGKGNVEGFDEVPVTFTHTRDDEGLGDIFTEDFQGTGLGTFAAYSVASNAGWEQTNFRDDLFAEMNGFGADVASDDWLISPALDLSAETSAFLSFVSTKNFNGGALEVLVSTDYDGISDPAGFTWDDLTSQATLSAGNFADTFSGEIDLSSYLTTGVYVAFRYTSTGTGGGDAALWQIDDVKISSITGGRFAKVDFVGADGTEYTALSYDPFGGDFEGILKDNDGNFWACDENRPAIYQFQPDGTLIERYVPAGTAMLGTNPQPAGTYGAETLPAVYSARRANRGFEAIAYDPDANVVYAFIQSPIEAPNSSVRNNTDVIRILGVDATNGTPVSEYVYLLENNANSGLAINRVDKIGDAVYIGNGKFMVLERDSSVPGQNEGKKYVFEISLTGATNVLSTDLATGNGGMYLEQLSADELLAAGVQAVRKTKVVNLPSIGYLPSDKPEGLAMLPNGAIAVLNDNDFGLAGAGVSDNSILGIIEFCDDNGIDASNRSDEIDIRNWPVLGMYQPDAIASFTINGKVYVATANEGDARDYDGFSEEDRVGDLMLDPTAYPNAAEIQVDEQLGRLNITTADGDYDGDGDYDQIFNYGARSFSIWDEYGNLVYDSGNEFARLIAEIDPDNFNSNNDENDSRKSRSDDKGVEPEAIEIVQQGDTTFALIGLERQGGIMIYNISDPKAPYFVNYFNNRDFSVEDATSPEVGDLGVETILYISAEDSPTGEPLVVTPNEVSGTITVWGAAFDEDGFMLRIIHNNDGESKLEPDMVGGRLIGGAAPFKTVVDSLKAIDMPYITLSSGDNFLAGTAFDASLNRAPGLPIYDAIVLDSIGYDAIAIGNHDFDFGPDVLARMINDFQVSTPPYLSANLDFSGEPNLQSLFDAGRIAKRTIVDVDGEQVGVVGLIYPEVASITSLGNVKVDTAITSIAQQQIDELIGLGVDKIILITHLQSINREIELISNLTDVDVVIAGGGDELLTNDPATNELPGITKAGDYPRIVKDAMGDDVYLVTTPGEYRYVGNLQIEFDDQGRVDVIKDGSDVILVADVTPDPGLQASVVDSIIAYAEALDAIIVARTEVDLDGTRANLRTRETNQGNLVADAFLWLGTENAATLNLDPNIPIVAFQNSGGIRNDEIIPAGSEISEKKVQDILAFDNTMVVTEPISPEDFKLVLENSVSAVNNVDGRFLQIAGFEFVWDTAGVAHEVFEDNISVEGTRIVSAKLADGTSIIENGQVVDGAPSIYLVTNNFTAAGGDEYLATLGKLSVQPLLGFTYRRALSEYLRDGVNGVVTAEQYPVGGEGRIRKLQDLDTSVEDLDLGALSFVASPNPFEDQFTVSYNLTTASSVVISLTDVTGRSVHTFTSEYQPAGQHTFVADQLNVAEGVYYLRVQIDGKVAAMPMVKQ